MIQEREMSEAESSQTMDSEDEPTHESESPITTDNEMETEEEENNFWMSMVEEAMQKHMAPHQEKRDEFNVQWPRLEYPPDKKLTPWFYLSSKRIWRIYL